MVSVVRCVSPSCLHAPPNHLARERRVSRCEIRCGFHHVHSRQGGLLPCNVRTMRTFVLIALVACGARDALLDQDAPASVPTSVGTGGAGAVGPITTGSSSTGGSGGSTGSGGMGGDGGGPCLGASFVLEGGPMRLIPYGNSLVMLESVDFKWNHILRADLDTGTLTTLIEPDWIVDISVFDEHVYYTMAQSIRRVPLGGGASELVIETTQSVGGVARDTEGMYWYEWGTPEKPQRFMRLAGEKVAVLAELDTFPFSWTLGERGVLFSDSYNVQLIPRDGGPVEILGSTEGVSRIFEDGSYEYWLEAEPVPVLTTTIARVPKVGGPLEYIVELSGYGQSAAALGSAYVTATWFEDGSSSIWLGTLPIEQPPTQVLNSYDDIAQVALTKDFFAWVDWADAESPGELKSMCRP